MEYIMTDESRPDNTEPDDNALRAVCLGAFASPDIKKRTQAIVKIDQGLRLKFHKWLIKNRCPAEESEMIIQDTMVAFMRHMDKKQAENPLYCPDSPQAYLFTTLRNCYREYIKKKGVEIPVESLEMLGELSKEPNRSNKLDLQLSFQKIFEFFRGAHPDCASALKLIVAEGINQKELAKSLGKSHVATRQFIHTCRKKFKLLWAEHTS